MNQYYHYFSPNRSQSFLITKNSPSVTKQWIAEPAFAINYERGEPKKKLENVEATSSVAQFLTLLIRLEAILKENGEQTK